MNFLFCRKQKFLVLFNKEETMEKIGLKYILKETYNYKKVEYISQKEEIDLFLNKVHNDDYIFIWCYEKEKMDWIYKIIHVKKKLNIFLLLDFIPSQSFLSCCLSGPFQPILQYNFHCFDSNIVSFYNTISFSKEIFPITNLFLMFLQERKETIYTRDILYKCTSILKNLNYPIKPQFHYSREYLQNFSL